MHAEKLLILLHDLVEPKLEMNERSISTLLNEIEKDPTAYLSVRRPPLSGLVGVALRAPVPAT